MKTALPYVIARFGSEELSQADSIHTQIVLEFGNAVFQVGAVVVVPADFSAGFWQLRGMMGRPPVSSCS
jgi:hypothetical protein